VHALSPFLDGGHGAGHVPTGVPIHRPRTIGQLQHELAADSCRKRLLLGLIGTP